MRHDCYYSLALAISLEHNIVKVVLNQYFNVCNMERYRETRSIYPAKES